MAFLAWLNDLYMNEKIWSVATPFSKISSERIGPKLYFGTFCHCFVRMDDNTHLHQVKSGSPVLGTPRTHIFWFWKIFDGMSPVDTFLIDSKQLTEKQLAERLQDLDKTRQDWSLLQWISHVKSVSIIFCVTYRAYVTLVRVISVDY